MKKGIFLVDMESFYASVEKASHPALKNRPVIVSGDPERRSGVVLAACPLAKKFGVENAERLGEAQKKCPDAVVIRPRMQTYLNISVHITDILERFTDQVEPYSVDEQFMDMTNSSKLFGDLRHIAEQIQQTIAREVNVRARVGIGPNKVLAKMACEGFAKKNDSGIFELNEHNLKKYMWPLPIKKMHGVGSRMSRHLNGMGIRTIGDLATYPLSILKKRWGIPGQVLWETANGIDASPVSADSHSGQKAIGHGMTLPRDYATKKEIKVVLLELCEQVCRRARSAGMMGKTVYVGASGEEDGFPMGFYRQLTLAEPTSHTMDVYKATSELFDRFWKHYPIRKLSVGISQLYHDNVIQLNFFNDVIRKRKLDDAIDEIKNRFGETAVIHASSLTDAGQVFHRSVTIGGHYK